MKATTSIRTAVIGVGNMGKNHVRVYKQISTLCAVSDTNPAIGNSIAHTNNVRYYAEYKTMLDQEKPDAVSVVVPTPLHKEIVLECLKRRIPTLVEKPIALTVKEARDMMRVSKKHHTFLLVGHIERFNPAVVKLKQLIKDGKVGRLFSLLTVRVGISPPKLPHANVITDLGIHDVDVCNYLLDEFPKEKYVVKQKIFNHTDVDSASLHLSYSNSHAVVITNWVTPIKMRKLYATGTKGFIELDYLTQTMTYYSEIIHAVPDGNYIEFISLLKSPKKELFVSPREPLKEELLYFLANRSRGYDEKGLHASLMALNVVS